MSLMSCSVNKVKSHMLFACKNFTNLTWNNNVEKEKKAFTPTWNVINSNRALHQLVQNS